MAELFTANPEMFENVNLHQLPQDILFVLSRKQSVDLIKCN